MSEIETGFFVTSGGSVLEMDIPPENTSARENFDDQVEKGDLRPIDAALVEKFVVSVDKVPAVGGGFAEVETYIWRRIGVEPDGDDSLDDMTKAQLIAYADANGIKLGGASTKAAIREAIDAATAPVVEPGGD